MSTRKWGLQAINSIMVTFVGFSTFGKRTGTRVLEDKELAKRDLLNHFYTRLGERLGEPEFGSILPDLIFEQFDEIVINAADDDVRKIIGADPRWSLEDYDIELDEHTITITVQLTYVKDLSSDTLVLEYRDNNEI